MKPHPLSSWRRSHGRAHPPPAGPSTRQVRPAGRPLDSTALRLLDVTLIAGATARLTRLVVIDDAGEPVRDVVRRLADRADRTDCLPGDRSWLITADDGLQCPYCVAVWVSAAVVGSYAAWGQRGWWQTVTGALTTSYAVGHAVARLDEE